MEVRRVEVPFLETRLIADVAGEDPSVLTLHGGGSSNRHRVAVIREALLERGLGSVAFDCIGHGETGGSLVGSCLHSRTDQALTVIRHLDFRQPLTLIGSSMGSYTALKLTELVKVQNLVLVVPAAFDIRGYDVPFGPQFSAIIRHAESWNDSDAWDILSRFRGNVLIVAGEKDEIIPRPVIDKMYASATAAQTRELLVFPGVDHHMMQHFTADVHDRQVFLSAFDRMMAAN